LCTTAKLASGRAKWVRGDPHACLKRGLDRVPKPLHSQARQKILRAMPHNIGAPEREARQHMPRDFYE